MLHDDSFRTGTSDTPVCACGLERETAAHFLLYCNRFQEARNLLLDRDVIIVFFSDIRFSELKIRFFSIIVYQPTLETGSDRRQVRMMSPAVRRQRTDVLLVVLAPRPRDSLQQQRCIPPTATVWCIQALAHRTVARVS